MSRLFAAAVLAAVGCTSSVTSTNPSPLKCQVSLRESIPLVASSGGTAVIDISAEPECAWTVASNLNWIAEVTPSSGQGSAHVEVRVAANQDPSPRQGTIAVGGTRVPIAQEAAPCVFEVEPRTRVMGQAGGRTSFTVTSATACSWATVSGVNWISVAPPSLPGTGSAVVTLDVAPNTGDSRTANITVAGTAVTIAQASGQAAPPQCTYAIDSSSQELAAAGANVAVGVTAGSGCAWIATSNASWLTILGAASGSGNGSVSFAAAPNLDASSRAAVLTIAGRPLAVTQAGTPGAPPPVTPPPATTPPATPPPATPPPTAPPAVPPPTPPPPAPCAYALSSASQTVVSAAGNVGAISVTTTASCGWTATSHVSWIMVTGGASGTGSGSVAFAVLANSGAERTGTMTIAGQTFTVTQGAPPPVCAYSITPSSQTTGAGGGAISVTVASGSGCSWSASSATPWASITSGTPGSGNGTLQIAVGSNTGAARSGSLTIAGQVFTVNQAAACAFGINPTSQSMSSAGGSGVPIVVTSAAGCTWSASSSASWITVTSGTSGSGNGNVNFSIAANGAGARSGTLTVAGLMFTVTQAAPCAFQVTPTTWAADRGGESGLSVSVTTAASCGWRAESQDPWITLKTGSSGSGSGSVTFAVAANPGKKRTGTLTIAGQTVTVTQAKH